MELFQFYESQINSQQFLVVVDDVVELVCDGAVVKYFFCHFIFFFLTTCKDNSLSFDETNTRARSGMVATEYPQMVVPNEHLLHMIISVQNSLSERK
jgi:hypothetical protein